MRKPPKKKNPGYSDRSPKSLLLKEIPYFTQSFNEWFYFSKARTTVQ